MDSLLLNVLQERVLIYDGAMGTQVHAADLSPDDYVLKETGTGPLAAATARQEGKSSDGCTDLLSITRPDVIERIHRSYLEAGADLIETNTFGATSIVLAEYDLQDLAYEMGLASALTARRAADAFTTADKPRFVVGAIGPGTKLASLGQTNWREIEDTYRDCFRGLIEGGADALLLETLQDLLLVKAGIVAASKSMADMGKQLPLFVQVTMEQTGTMLVGTEMAAALNTIEAFPAVTAFGMNCATGPVEMGPHIRFLSQNSTRPICVQPNAGLPQMEGGRAVYKLSPDQLAAHHVNFVEQYGVALCGGCCGTTPAHIKAVNEAVGGRPHTANAHWIKIRNQFPGFDFEVRDPEQASAFSLVGCSSLYLFQPYHQDNSILIVGEKTNANGSKAFKEMLANDNWDGLTELAREQEAEGSHVLDVCTAFVGRDEVRDMKILLGYYNRHVNVPLMLDSTEMPVIEAALQTVAGKPLVNSINFEDGGGRVEAVLKLCRTYGAGVVALTIDEIGMAKSVEHKLEVADRLIEATRRHGLPDHDVFIDALTFTLGGGQEEFRKSAEATIDAIRKIKEKYPRVNSILGVSNVSFGLRPAIRQILNSTFLHFAEEAGLTSAIVHFSKIVPESKIDPEVWQLTSDLIYDRRRFA